ncbi:hypothetical protein M409DRAFT_62685 [Zasmidium cellare ATCC 36951]|uniref:Bromodomain-containing protein n=1 Tax=Zasmidium cellare ATCC 36951 TaxID=1080233 RepID=A0A6A6D4D4_ZASCE|nr:uncharacterized protein M409DRAFT_62685 [Zasmidium cellare ATCC 36951]KAF2173062.1 hypothetical protein M409DRAFT_62685 [Zasmidium cellare ATCC 36951]
MADIDSKPPVLDLPALHGDQDDHATAATNDLSNNTGAFAENAAVSGITPVADYIPKDATTSHPTPPPDEPLATSEANVDVDMKADEVPKVESVSEPQSAVSEPAVAPVFSSTDSSLVRPREDDDDGDDDERAAKRSRVDGDLDQDQDVTLPDAPPVDSVVSAPPQPEADPPVTTTADISQAPEVAAAAPTAPEASPDPQRAPSEDPPAADVDAPTTNELSDDPTSVPAAAQSADEPPAPLPNGESASQPPPPEAEAKPEDAKPVQAPAQDAAQPAAPSNPTYSKEPLTQPQIRYLVDKLKNMKKTKHASSFLFPVDYVALNIPTYPDVIKNPMDLSTLENKLKTLKYGSVQDFADDFDLIIQNSRTFNGDAHPVTVAGFSMQAYMRKILETIPSANQVVLQKPQPKKASPKPQPRRESRAVTQPTAPPAAAAPAPAATSVESFALQPDGTPQIRRDSTINRPARTIKPPPARELTYSKPKRKEHQLELKFCEHVLFEVKSPKYGSLNSVFMHPVDPVALNIPHYRQIVKQPMDLSTMTQKLKQGQYGKASEFKKDFELMINNCLVFNPHGNPVRDMGVQFKREFEALWQTKEKWEKARKAELQRGTSASADEYSGDEEEEEEEEGEEDKSSTIAALQKQLQQIQGALAEMNQPAKKKTSKNPKTKTTKKSLGGGAPPPNKKPVPKPKAPKKPKQVTYEEKQEISDAVGRMSEDQVSKLTKIITDNCQKYADQEEMELEIDDLPNDVQAMLLTYVRSLFGKPSRAVRADSPDDAAALDDDDFEPTERGGRRGGGGAGNKRKKHKPMHKEEQQKAINDIKNKLAQFQNATSASPSQQEESSGDESEESEEE